MPKFLHERRDFNALIAVVADQRRIDPVLVEKDYWIMHCLWGLTAQSLFQRGMSLSEARISTEI